MNENLPHSLKDQPNINEVILSWKSASHPYKKRSKVFYQTMAALTLLVVLVVFFFHEYMLIGVILSIVFVAYVISTVPPIEVEHKIKHLGFENAGRLFRWIELYAFWFDQRWGERLMVVQTRLPFPGQIRAIIDEEQEENLKEIIGKYLVYFDKPQKTWSDNLSDWLVKKFPLETTG